MNKNKVTSKWSAIIDGKETGLAGCVKACEGCIRGDDALNRVHDLGPKQQEPCKYRIGY